MNFGDISDSTPMAEVPHMEGTQNVLAKIISISISLLMDFLNVRECSNEFVLKKFHHA